MNERYRKQVALLIRIMPSLYRIKDFAVHGGTAINLFHKDMPRYSVDVDITYIPVKGREESLQCINTHLSELKQINRPPIAIVLKGEFQILRSNAFFIKMGPFVSNLGS